MVKHSKTDDGAKGPATLPKGYSFSPGAAAGTGDIAMGGGKVGIAASSYDSVSNVLNGLWPEGTPSLRPGATLVITDGFTGRSASVLASALPDVVAVLNAFVVAEESPAADQAASETAVRQEEGKAAVRTRKREGKPAPAPARQPKAAAAKADAPVAAPPPEAPPEVVAAPAPAAAAAPAPAVRKSAPKAKGKAKAKPRAKAAVSLKAHEMPEWFVPFGNKVKVDDGQGGTANLVKCGLQLDTGRVNHVKGRSKNPDKATGWGYEVLSGGKRVAWIIAAAPDKLVVTDVVGDPAYVPSKHKHLDGVSSRLTAIVMPKFFEMAA